MAADPRITAYQKPRLSDPRTVVKISSFFFVVVESIYQRYCCGELQLLVLKVYNAEMSPENVVAPQLRASFFVKFRNCANVSYCPYYFCKRRKTFLGTSR